VLKVQRGHPGTESINARMMQLRQGAWRGKNLIRFV
jgi:hypothetical protein